MKAYFVYSLLDFLMTQSPTHTSNMDMYGILRFTVSKSEESLMTYCQELLSSESIDHSVEADLVSYVFTVHI